MKTEERASSVAAVARSGRQREVEVDRSGRTVGGYSDQTTVAAAVNPQLCRGCGKIVKRQVTVQAS